MKSKIYLEKLDEAEFVASSFYLITTGLQPEMIWPAAISNPSISRTAVSGEHESALQWLQGQNNHILLLPNAPNISPIWSPSSVKNKGFHYFFIATNTNTHMSCGKFRHYEPKRPQKTRKAQLWGENAALVSLPALTVMASMNWSLQLLVPTSRARLVFLISLSTVFWQTENQPR